MGDLRDFYTETLGCTEWSGSAYESECVSKMNWSCPDTEHVLQFVCGLVGQLGGGFLLGGMLGSVKAIASVASVRKSVALNPVKFGVSKIAQEELDGKKGLGEIREKIKNKTEES